MEGSTFTLLRCRYHHPPPALFYLPKLKFCPQETLHLPLPHLRQQPFCFRSLWFGLFWEPHTDGIIYYLSFCAKFGFSWRKIEVLEHPSAPCKARARRTTPEALTEGSRDLWGSQAPLGGAQGQKDRILNKVTSFSWATGCVMSHKTEGTAQMTDPLSFMKTRKTGDKKVKHCQSSHNISFALGILLLTRKK